MLDAYKYEKYFPIIYFTEIKLEQMKNALMSLLWRGGSRFGGQQCSWCLMCSSSNNILNDENHLHFNKFTNLPTYRFILWTTLLSHCSSSLTEDFFHQVNILHMKPCKVDIKLKTLSVIKKKTVTLYFILFFDILDCIQCLFDYY